jgi:glutathione S-transferase
MAAVADQVPVTLFGHWICPFSVRVEFALAQRGIAYDTVNVPPTAARPKGFVVPQEFVDNSPKGEVPMIRIDGHYLADSIPILEHLETMFADQSLLGDGTSESAELVRERVRWIDRYVYRSMIEIYYGTDPVKIHAASERLSLALGELVTVADLSDPADWLVGDRPTLAEALMVPLYVRLDGLRRLGFSHEVPGSISAHMQRCEELAGWKRVVWSPEQIDEFVWRFQTFRERLRAKADAEVEVEPSDRI